MSADVQELGVRYGAAWAAHDLDAIAYARSPLCATRLGQCPRLTLDEELAQRFFRSVGSIMWGASTTASGRWGCCYRSPWSRLAISSS
jgi:hypothetical protein